MEGRNDLFQKLKPPCVALGQAALALNGPRGDGHIVTTELEKVRRILDSATSTSSNVLDAKLAEYVFFPIAQLLKVSQRLSITALELCLECVAILIDKGWRQDIPAPLAGQLLILCSLLAERRPKGLSFSETTAELQALSFWCMYHLFSVVGPNSETVKLLRSETNFPQLGQTISVILDGIYDGGSIEAQVAATNALTALVVNITDAEVQASFLPGIVSKLTRVLTPQTKLRRNHTVLIGCLKLLQLLLRNTMADQSSLEPVKKDDMGAQSTSARRIKSIIDAKWQKSAATQLKPALSNILRLKSNSRDDVKDAVASLCLTILQHCRMTLDNSSQMTLETLVTLAAERLHSDASRELRVLMQLDGSISTLLQSQLYDWLQSLPTVTQGSDEHLKLAKLQQITTGYQLLKEAGTNTDTIDRMLATTLRDCVVVTLNVPALKQESAMFNPQLQSLDVEMVNGETAPTGFSAALVKYKGQEDFLDRVEQLTKLITESNSPSSFTGDLLRHLEQSQGDSKIANFWLSLNAIRNLLHQKSNVDDLLNIEDGSYSVVTEYLEELYSFSLGILTESSNESQDQRLQALALQGLAMRAKDAGLDFRYELVDALYPALHRLATPNAQLQRDSIAALNVFSSACGYASVKDLIVENVDYLTNSVALKLNAFDVSPQAPQVLLMMVRLAGPNLLPYLEDTVESIFAALENYHGYPLLVELLFQVLSVVAEEGARAPQLMIAAEDRSSLGDVIDKWNPSSISSLSELLRKRAAQAIEGRGTENGTLEKHPQVPWKDVNSIGEYKEDIAAGENEDEDVQMEDVQLLPPVPKTYNLLLKIDDLTQHFLPSSSPSLRSRLLNLIKITVPAIARHENSFLPLINTLWPEIVSRLDDEEQYIVASALDVIGMLSQYAGDFLRTRVRQIWPRLKEIYQAVASDILQSTSYDKRISSATRNTSKVVASTRTLTQAMHGMETAPSAYGDTGTRMLWSSFIKTVATLVQHTKVSPEMFDEALEMAAPVLEVVDVRLAFEKENTDAVWLYDIQTGAISKPATPVVPGGVAPMFAPMPD
jgi:hypothetical protein